MGRAAVFGERKLSRLNKMLTDKQLAVLVFLWNFYERNDQLPPCDRIAAHFKFASTNAAHRHLDSIARKGWIEKNECGKWKFAPISRDLFVNTHPPTVPALPSAAIGRWDEPSFN